MTTPSTPIVPLDRITQSIVSMRGHRVMLDVDLAALYGVETKVLVQTVKRNIQRFPQDFMFQLSDGEFAILRSQSVTSSGWGGRRYPPYAFTEQGVAMLSTVLRSARAIDKQACSSCRWGELDDVSLVEHEHDPVSS